MSVWDYPPWGRTYGTHSPFYRAYERGGKLLMLGTTYDTTTYIHLVEVMRWNRMLEEDPEAVYPSIDRDVLGAWWDRQGRQGRLRRGRAGDSYCRLFPDRRLHRHPGRRGRPRPGCLRSSPQLGGAGGSVRAGMSGAAEDGRIAPGRDGGSGHRIRAGRGRAPGIVPDSPAPFHPRPFRSERFRT